MKESVTSIGEPVSHRNTLLANVSWTVVGRLVYAGCQFGLLLLLARLSGAAKVGAWGLALAVTAPIYTFLQFHLRSVVATDSRDEFHIGDYVGLSMLSFVCGMLIVAAVTVWAGYDATTARIVLVVAAAKGVECLSEVFLGVMQRFERLDICAWAFIAKGVGSIVVVASVLLATGDLFLALTGMLVVWSSLLLWYYIPQAMRLFPEREPLRPRFNRGVLKRLVLRSLPLGVAAAALSLNLNIPRYFVEEMHGRELLGYLTVLTYLMIVGELVANAVARSGIAGLGKAFHTDRRRFRHLFVRLLVMTAGIGVAMTAGTWLLGRPFLALCFGAEYAAYAPVLVWLMAGAVAAYANHVVLAAHVSMRMHKTWAGIAIAGAIFCYLGGRMLVPTYGLAGAAGAYGIASLSNLVLGVATAWWGSNQFAATTEPPLAILPTHKAA